MPQRMDSCPCGIPQLLTSPILTDNQAAVLNRLANSNAAPSAQEQATLELLSSQEAFRRNQLESLKSQIDLSLKENILTQERLSLALNVVRRLSFDVLREVFLWAVYSDDMEMDKIVETFLDHGYVEGGLHVHSAWSLSHVSSYWRAVALSVPQIWSHMHLFLLESHLTSSDVPVQSSHLHSLESIIQLQLERSSNYPLTIFLTCETDIPHESPIIQHLLNTSSRWRRLFIRIPLSSFPIFQPIKGTLDSLELLCLHFSRPSPGGNEDPSIGLTTTAFEIAPRLTHLIASPALFPGLPIPTNQITKLQYIRGFPPNNEASQTLSSLQHFPNARECIIPCRVESGATYYSNSLGQMALKGVTKLTLRELTKDTGAAGIDQLSLKLSFPELRELRVEGDILIHTVAVFVRVSQVQNLHYLALRPQDDRPPYPETLNIHTYAGPAAYTLLYQLAELESLELDTSGTRRTEVYHGICQQLIEYGPEDLCKNLRMLKISGCKIPSSDLTQLREARPLLSVIIGKSAGMEEAEEINA
jgi:hypothetical protein